MTDLKAEVAKFNGEYAKLQDMFKQALGLLQGEPEFAVARDMTTEVTAKHQEWLQNVNPAIDWLQQEEKDLQQGLAQAQERIAEVEKQLNDALAEAEKAVAAPAALPAVVVPGEGNPEYGFSLGAELLGLIGLGSAAGQERRKLGDVWELESVDWKVESGTTEAPRPASPAQRPAEQPTRKPPDRDQSIGQSVDW
jgi:hypothetical protein